MSNRTSQPEIAAQAYPVYNGAHKRNSGIARAAKAAKRQEAKLRQKKKLTQTEETVTASYSDTGRVTKLTTIYRHTDA